MGKVVMPKNSALLEEIEAALGIYYEANDWLDNNIYKEQLKAIIGADQYSSSYTKKTQILSYYGFTIWQDINNPRSPRRITNLGKEMYYAIQEKNKNKIFSILMYSLENMTFGKNNCGCPDSKSDIEPPALFIRAILDLSYLTYFEFAYLLWKLNDIGATYSDSIELIRESRTSTTELATTEETSQFNKYIDCKPIMCLVRWGFLEESNEGTTRLISLNKDVYSKFSKRLRNLKIYNIDKNIDLTTQEQERYSFGERVSNGKNIILYGVPGSGKSRKIKDDFCNDEKRMMRIIFHPDYTYADFIGQILPKTDGHNITYEFISGPFTKMLKMANDDPLNSYYLIIEEINRGNAAAIFGETFQLLDRITDDSNEQYPIGTSEYDITNFYIADEVYGDPFQKVRIPSNLTIIGTMNTSDQNVFTLDTAFQRRWEMEHVPNEFDNEIHREHVATEIEDGITWYAFATIVNETVVNTTMGYGVSEDKQLGLYFAKNKDFEKKKFAEKVLKYLWDDAVKMDKSTIFNTDKVKTFEAVVKTYTKEGLKGVLVDSLYGAIKACHLPDYSKE